MRPVPAKIINAKNIATRTDGDDARRSILYRILVRAARDYTRVCVLRFDLMYSFEAPAVSTRQYLDTRRGDLTRVLRSVSACSLPAA
jgi:hypothetical protein